MCVLLHSTIIYANAVCSGKIRYNESVHVLDYKIIQAPNNTWGYDIIQSNKVLIHQPNKPGLPGQEGFATKKDASKVAKLVIAKIKRGEMPPTISIDELKALKVIH